MIKINLLHSVTERNAGAAVTVERKIASPSSRLLLMALTIGFLLAAVVVFDVLYTQRLKSNAEAELEEQKQIAAQLESVMKEQKELEDKIKNIDTRIEVIKKLRGSQAGPSAVLQAMSERIGMFPEIYLDSVEQTGETVTIKGSSSNEDAITKLGGSLEFSNGLFTNLNIEIQRAEIPGQQVSTGATEAPKASIINFTIRCGYKPSKSGDATTAANGQPGTAPTSPAPAPPVPQVAKNQ